jgi:hypothetical protein
VQHYVFIMFAKSAAGFSPQAARPSIRISKAARQVDPRRRCNRTFPPYHRAKIIPKPNSESLCCLSRVLEA